MLFLNVHFLTDAPPIQAKGVMVKRAEKCPYCDSYLLKNSSDYQRHIWAHQGLIFLSIHLRDTHWCGAVFQVVIRLSSICPSSWLFPNGEDWIVNTLQTCRKEMAWRSISHQNDENKPSKKDLTHLLLVSFPSRITFSAVFGCFCCF